VRDDSATATVLDIIGAITFAACIILSYILVFCC